jgi:hypothetical protein
MWPLQRRLAAKQLLLLLAKITSILAYDGLRLSFCLDLYVRLYTWLHCNNFDVKKNETLSNAQKVILI